MCHVSCLGFATELTASDVAGKRVLEVGSYDINGSVRDGIEMLGCTEYIGVDMRDGRGVDEVCDASNLVERFGPESFDIIISTEMMEHVEDWRAAISNMKRVCKRGGLIMITTRSKGYPKHDYPGDFWRYEIKDMKTIFSDCDILKLEDDLQAPGVFVLVQKPKSFREVNLSRYKLYGLSTLETCERETGMETQETIATLRVYAEGKMKGAKALFKAKEAAHSFAPSHNRTLVLQDIDRKLAGQEISPVLHVRVDEALVDLVGGPEPTEDIDSDAVDLSDISYPELRSMCKDAELPVNGSKEDLIERLTSPDDPTKE